MPVIDMGFRGRVGNVGDADATYSLTLTLDQWDEEDEQQLFGFLLNQRSDIFIAVQSVSLPLDWQTSRNVPEGWTSKITLSLIGFRQIQRLASMKLARLGKRALSGILLGT